MLAVRASLAEINSHSGDKPLEVACLNELKGTVLGGTVEEIEELAKMLEAAGFKYFHLDVDFAFHSAQTDPLLDDLEEMARTGAIFYPPNLPIISPLLGRVIFDEKTINASYIRRATRETVNFLAAVETASRMSTVDETMVTSVRNSTKRKQRLLELQLINHYAQYSPSTQTWHGRSTSI